GHPVQATVWSGRLTCPNSCPFGLGKSSGKSSGPRSDGLPDQFLGPGRRRTVGLVRGGGAGLASQAHQAVCSRRAAVAQALADLALGRVPALGPLVVRVELADDPDVVVVPGPGLPGRGP